MLYPYSIRGKTIVTSSVSFAFASSLCPPCLRGKKQITNASQLRSRNWATTYGKKDSTLENADPLCVNMTETVRSASGNHRLNDRCEEFERLCSSPSVVAPMCSTIRQLVRIRTRYGTPYKQRSKMAAFSNKASTSIVEI